MRSHPDPAERPDGLETRPSSASLPDDADRPDWLVGADDVLENPSEQESPRRLSVTDAPATPLRVVEGGKPAAPRGWSGAASSIPRLKVVAAPERIDPGADDEDVPGDRDSLSPALGEEESSSGSRAQDPAFRPLDEPWYLVWAEALAMNRRLQITLVVAATAIAAFLVWPRGGAQGTSLIGILSHPERYQGKTVAVRGEVLEIFEVGQGYAFQLRQGRSTVVVYSMLREPRLHDRVEVKGTVSTGYLDGAPRVAIFEGGAP